MNTCQEAQKVDNTLQKANAESQAAGVEGQVATPIVGENPTAADDYISPEEEAIMVMSLEEYECSQAGAEGDKKN